MFRFMVLKVMAFVVFMVPGCEFQLRFYQDGADRSAPRRKPERSAQKAEAKEPSRTRVRVERTRGPNESAKEPSRDRVREWFKHNNSAPPAEWYKNGDPWRNPTAEELEEFEDDSRIIGGGG